MSLKTQIVAAKLCGATLLAAVALAGSLSVAQAQMSTESDIVRALTPRGGTRSLTITPITPPSATATVSDDGAFIDTLRAKSSRSLTTTDRAKLAAITSEKPTVNLEIPFSYNSSAIGARTRPAVQALGAALSRPEFKGGTFTIAGHTDGRGGDQSNLALSERRAEAVKRFLVQTYGIPATNLISVGYGKARPKNAADPYADENRRVEVTNLSDIKSASN